MKIETKTYSDGTTATGVAPLPLLSPDQQTQLADLDAIEALLGGRNGPTIRLRSALASKELQPDHKVGDTAIEIVLSIHHALRRYTAAEVLDENSPVRDSIRELVEIVSRRATPDAATLPSPRPIPQGSVADEPKEAK